MKVKIDINPQYEEEPVVTIQVKEWTEEVEALVHMLQHAPSAPLASAGAKPTEQPLNSKRIVAVEEDRSILLDPDEIDYVFAEGRKVFAKVNGQSMQLKLKLYELEKFLSPHGFIRFSKSVVGNINQIDRFELSFNGNLCVYFKSGNKEYVTRKYVRALKEQIIGGGSHGT